jgi:hypothetical protein
MFQWCATTPWRCARVLKSAARRQRVHGLPFSALRVNSLSLAASSPISGSALAALATQSQDCGTTHLSCLWLAAGVGWCLINTNGTTAMCEGDSSGTVATSKDDTQPSDSTANYQLFSDVASTLDTQAVTDSSDTGSATQKDDNPAPTDEVVAQNIQKEISNMIEDMYENLPETDVETNCFLCKVHRQGPCRRVWRNFEYCIKDHMDDDSKTNVCDKYVPPFEACLMQHARLYALVALQVYHQESVSEIESDFRYGERPILEPWIDWSAWTDFCQKEEHREELQQALEMAAKCTDLEHHHTNQTLWQKFVAMEKEPILVHIHAKVAVIKDKGQLQTVYALDQEGRTLGFAFYDEEYERTKADKAEKPLSPYHSLTITIIPGVTRSVRICALYNDTSEDGGDSETEQTLYESLVLVLEEIASDKAATEANTEGFFA